MFHFETCENIREQRGGRGWDGGGLVEVEGRVVWGRGGGGVYMLDDKDKWKRLTGGVEVGATLGVCGGRLVTVGGYKGGSMLEMRGGSAGMLVACRDSCVVNVGGSGLVVMGGIGDGANLADIQVFNGKTQTWHFGPSLPKRCAAMSAVVHEDLVFEMGGAGMATAVWCANINDLVSPLCSISVPLIVCVCV